ncbi:MAG: sialate O-acetylesterase [Lacunisphaera sp.]
MKIFLLIGQSNMAGRGVVEPQDRTPHPRVFMLNKELAWVPAVDPMHFDKPERVGTGLGKTFGLVLADADPASVIGLVPAAFGGSALDEWAPGQPHYVNAVARAKEALKHGKLAGILWHQGESDSAPDKVATYQVRFAQMIAQLRADLDAPEVPVVVGETGRFRADGAAINAVLAQLPESVPHCAFVSAEGLGDQGDKLHFDSAGFRELGRRYAAAWQALSSPVTMLKPVMLMPKKQAAANGR